MQVGSSICVITGLKWVSPLVLRRFADPSQILRQVYHPCHSGRHILLDRPSSPLSFLRQQDATNLWTPGNDIARISIKSQTFVPLPSPPFFVTARSWEILPWMAQNFPFLEQDVSPPSYHETTRSPIPFIVTETTTTCTEVVTTTTETTTRFVSLTGWKRHNNVDDTMLQRPQYSGNTEEGEGPPLKTSSMRRDKALPPTPPGTFAHPATLDRNRSTQITEGPSLCRDGPSRSLQGPGRPQFTSLSPLSSSSLPCQMNATAFPAAVRHPQDRQIRSSQQLERPRTALSPEVEASQRTRRLSLGPTALLKFGAPDTKPKADSPKSLLRKRSFWSRKRTDDPNSQRRPSTAHGQTPHSLTSMEVDLSHFPPPNVRQPNPQVHDLSLSPTTPRSLYPSTEPEFFSISTTPNSRSQVTQGPTAQPIAPERTAVASPSIPGSRKIASVNLTEKMANMSLPVPRARSLSSSPLLHRLSFNVFSSSPAISTFTSPLSSPSLSAAPQPTRKSVVIPRPRGDQEPPDVYVDRLMELVSNVEVVNTLASRQMFCQTAASNY